MSDWKQRAADVMTKFNVLHARMRLIDKILDNADVEMPVGGELINGRELDMSEPSQITLWRVKRLAQMYQYACDVLDSER